MAQFREMVAAELRARGCGVADDDFRLEVQRYGGRQYLVPSLGLCELGRYRVERSGRTLRLVWTLG